MKFVFETIPAYWNKLIGWFKELPTKLAHGLVGLIPNIFGIQDWLAKKLGVDVRKAAAFVAPLQKKMAAWATEIMLTIKEAILNFIPNIFGIRKFIGNWWGIDTESESFGQRNIFTKALSLFDQMRETIMRTILNLVVPSIFGIRKAAAKLLNVDLKDEKKLDDSKPIPISDLSLIHI